MATTAGNIIKGAFGLIGVYQPNETMSPTDGQDGLRRLNNMMGQLALQPGSIPCRIREVFDTVSGQGGPDDPYTIGDGADFDTSRPAVIDQASILLTQASPNPVEVDLAILTNDAYDAIQVKNLSNSQPTSLFYQPRSPWGHIFLWPVPNVSYNDLVIYRLAQLSTFSSLTASYDLPNGYDEMLEYNLAKRLAVPYGKLCPPDVQQIAATSLMIVKRPNTKIADLPQEIAQGNRSWGYNIQTGNF